MQNQPERIVHSLGLKFINFVKHLQAVPVQISHTAV